MFWNISIILANAWLRKVKFENLWIFENKTSVTLEANSEAYSKPCQTSKMEVLTKIVNGLSLQKAPS